MARDQHGGGLRLTDHLALLVVAVFAVFIAFWVLSSVASLVWWFVKVAVVVALVWLVFRLLVGHRRG